MNKNQLLYIKSLYEMIDADKDKTETIMRNLFYFRDKLTSQEIKGITSFIINRTNLG